MSAKMADDSKQPKDRDVGRAASYRLQQAAVERGEPLAWFDELYAEATGNRARIPWSDAAPRDAIAAWLKANPGEGRTALDVGCGLGDNAQLLAQAGYRVTAFDISDSAVRWAREAARNEDITFEQADLFDLPTRYEQSFNLVHETYNLQALPRERVSEATAAIARCVAPGGILLVISRIREEQEQPDGPPWPLPRSALLSFEEHGLALVETSEFTHGNSRQVPHMLVQFKKPPA